MPDAPRIPARFRATVLEHVLRCFIVDPTFGGSQVLAIVGPPGVGKTFQLSRACVSADVQLVSFNAVDAEHPNSNRPIVRLRECLEEVETLLASQLPAALVLDDADLLLGRFGNTQYTHNLQRLLAELMSVAGSITVDRSEPRRLPIFLIANDIDVVHAPLFRAGRARRFDWLPSPTEQAEIVSGLFPLLTEIEAARLSADFPDQPVAFFASLRDAMVDSHVRRLLRDEEPATVLRWALIHAASARPSLSYDYADALAIGESLLAQVPRPQKNRFARR